MKTLTRISAAAVAIAVVIALAAVLPAAAKPKRPESVRFATFNVSLHRESEGALLADLSTRTNTQAQAIGEILQTTRPDVVLLNEFDYVDDYAAIDAFRKNYLRVSQNGRIPIDYPFAFTAPVNTGVATSHDLNRDGVVGGPDDAYGYGSFPGQYGMVLLSRFPIDLHNVRTFRNFLWKDMPGALLPDDPATGKSGGWYSRAALDDLRLSSKSHWDVPIRIGRSTVHALVSHPTPPSFDGPELRNKKRNHDEIRFWSDYVTPGAQRYIYDDRGVRGGLHPSESFVILGDLNSDPFDGDSIPGAIQQVLQNKRVIDPLPASDGGTDAAARQGGANLHHSGDPAYHTADFNDDPAPGNLRVDYVLPSRKGLLWTQSGVFWPTAQQPDFRLVGDYPFLSSDHRLVWVDVHVR